MATYEFECTQCGRRFSVEESMRQHQQHREKCPKCGSRKVEQLISAFHVKTSKKS